MAGDKIYCSGTKTKAGFFSMIRSGLRRLTIRWAPRNDHLAEIRKPYVGDCKKTKWLYPCAVCKQWFVRAKTEVDHKVKCGSLKDFEDIGPFCQKLFAEKDGWECLCKPCHLIKTNAERGK